jgi:hypothetical protein
MVRLNWSNPELIWSHQWLIPRKGVLINDQVAENITRTEELAYELKISEVMTRDVNTLHP